MKTRTHWMGALATLAIIATPLSFSEIVEASRHPASQSSSIQQNEHPHLTKMQATLVRAQVTEHKTLINLTVNDPEFITKLNNQLKTEKERAESLQSQLEAAHAQLANSQESNEQAQKKIEELEAALQEHVKNVTYLESHVKTLDENLIAQSHELIELNTSLTHTKDAAEQALQSLEEAQNKIAEINQALEEKDQLIAQRNAELEARKAELEEKNTLLTQKSEDLTRRDQELAEKEERLSHKREELKRQKKKHDIFVCESELRFTALSKQIEDLNKQQERFTQVMLGLNQLLLGFLGQQQRIDPMHGQGFNYFGMGYQPNPFAMGQMPSAQQNAITGQYPFNPWLQPQSQIINNYYGMTPGMQPQMPGQMNPMPHMPQGLMQPQSYFMPGQQNPIPGSFNFGMPNMFDGSRAPAEFGNFQPMDQGMAMPMMGPALTSMPQMFQ
jgi:hypothetical protein